MEVCETYNEVTSNISQGHSSSSISAPTKIYNYPLLRNVHLALCLPSAKQSSAKIYNATGTDANVICGQGGCSTFLTRGNFSYFHYECDGYADSGWGCAYRTLQSACSWLLDYRRRATASLLQAPTHDIEMIDMEENADATSDAVINQQVPSLLEIQQTLVRIGDKPRSFVGSRDWIGALEVFYVLDTLYDVPCKILHIPQRDDLKKYANVLKKYFEDFGGFVMMGGDVDAAAKGIAGIHISGNQAYFLVIDPHFVGKPKSAQELIERGYIRWQHTSEFVDSSFYNLCLPQIK